MVKKLTEDDLFRQDAERACEIALNMVNDSFVTYPEYVLELLFIVTKYDESDRRILIREITEAIYPQGDEGQKAIAALINRAKQAAGVEVRA